MTEIITADGMENEKRALYLLSCMKGMLSDKLMNIYEHFGSFYEAYLCSVEEYSSAGLFKTDKIKAAYKELKMNEDILLKKYDAFAAKGIRIVTIFDTDYPERLRTISEMPPILYVRGRLPSEVRPSAAVIGSRKCSSYGAVTAELIAEELSKNGIQVISGLAYGVDSAAALGALNGGGESYAVLGCGINICYPKENWKLFQRMSEGEGGILSEFAPDTAALGYHFVLRNRIIAGLSDIVVVTEAGEKSGTFSTIEYALAQGKDVLAVPGRITDRTSAGCNRLIRDGAGIITSTEDVLDYFYCDTGWKRPGQPELQERAERLHGPGQRHRAEQTERPDWSFRKAIPAEYAELREDELTENEKRVLGAMSADEQHIEAIAATAGVDIGSAAAALQQLESRGAAVSCGSAYYRLSRRIY